MQENIIYQPAGIVATRVTPTISYSQTLDEYEIEYIKTAQFLEAGVIDWVQGWILDISIILPQIDQLLKLILPLLKEHNIPFKMARNLGLANSILCGEEGIEIFGKFISIYPISDDQAHQLAISLIQLTSHLIGPEIPTDWQLSGIVHARYGACNPSILTEPLSMPFSLPPEINWPFKDIASPAIPKKETVLQDRYKPIKTLKHDTKGSVKKGLWLKRIFDIRWCVIKEGKKHMLADIAGQDISDRLRWQFELQKDLKGYLPIPEAYDLFEENGDTYLAMQFIRGISLNSAVLNTIQQRPWIILPKKEQKKLFEYANQLIDIISRLHAKGYIHRDIAPGNFLVDKQDKIWLIDLELAYSMPLQKPFPPFRLGTPGFMPPEQSAPVWETLKLPDEQIDLYAIGACLIFIFTGLFPLAFQGKKSETTVNDLEFFLRNREMAQILANSLSFNPKLRPSLSSIKSALDSWQTNQSVKYSNALGHMEVPPMGKEQVAIMIQSLLTASSSAHLTNVQGLWISGNRDQAALKYSNNMSSAIYTDYYSGISGAIYTVAKAQMSGFDISLCLPTINENIDFLISEAAKSQTETAAALMTGSIGIAIALMAASEADFIQYNEQGKNLIYALLANEKTIGYGIRKGISGRGLALLKAIHMFKEKRYDDLLLEIIAQLKNDQLPDGSWPSSSRYKNRSASLSAGFERVASVTNFLLQYLLLYEDATVEQVVQRSLSWLFPPEQQRSLAKGPSHQKYPLEMLICAMKAYSYYGTSFYSSFVELNISTNQPNILKQNLTLDSGLCMLGELYLEAYKELKNEEWLHRSEWILNVLLHYSKNIDNGHLWLVDGSPIPSSSLFTGNMGVLHFLLRYYNLKDISHPLLPQ